ncbi:MAG: integrase arm-type DNA-binding domain-containing protein, partial [Alphaproteobacteria bacterium]
MMVLGKLGAMTLSQARDSARNALALVRDGKDPLEEKRKAAHGETLGDLNETYIEAYARPRKKTWKADQQRLARYIPAAWKSRDVRAIAQWEVAKLHQTIGEDRPY